MSVATELHHRRIIYGSVDIRYRPDVLRTNEWFMAGNVAVFHNESSLLNALRGVRWHDSPEEHCPTWSEGCRCDLAEEA